MSNPHAPVTKPPVVLERLIVGLSGGVDSAVAARLLVDEGHQVEGLFMKNWEEDDVDGHCTAAEDLADARAVAEHLGIPLRTVNFATEYWDRVFERFLAEHRAGRTPNPDVLCNSEIKFEAFLDHALTLGATGIATGHYARLRTDERGHHLCLAVDSDKDQTYFLHRLAQRQLGRSRFPLAGLRKGEVRRMAQQIGLRNAAKKDSTGICFVGERRFREFLARFLRDSPGPIETPDGEVIGEHRGIAFFTIGQRQGLGIGGVRGSREAPWFVARKDPARQALIVVQGTDHPWLFSRDVEATDPHWIAGSPPGDVPFPCQARLRHRQPLQDCLILGYDQHHCQVRFDRPQRAVTPGQAIVFYCADECLGGAVVDGVGS